MSVVSNTLGFTDPTLCKWRCARRATSAPELDLPSLPSVNAQTNPEVYDRYAKALDTKLTAALKTIRLKQSDFVHGAVRITKPGRYVLDEDIVFSPNADTDFQPHNSALYPDFTLGGAYHLGFFAAVTIETQNVILDLQGHTIEQSPEHALVQRFFAIIELADQPFVPGQGPADFGKKLASAHNVVIKNGTLGRSSHHGIHGNGNSSVVLSNLKFKDFEVAAIALNGGSYVCMSALEIGPSRQDVPIMGTFSQANFIQKKVNAIVSRNPAATLGAKTGPEILAALKEALKNPGEKLFVNVPGNTDGSAYGILLNPLGVAVNGFRTATPPKAVLQLNNCHNSISYVSIRGLHTTSNEVPAVATAGTPSGTPSYGAGAGVLIGPIGSVLKVTPGAYEPTVISDAQLFVAKNGVGPRERGTTNIPPEVVAWAESGTSWTPDYWVWGGDTMHHVSKGNVGLFLNGVTDACIREVVIDGVINDGLGSRVDPGKSRKHSAQNIPYYDGSSSRGIALAGSARVTLTGVKVKNIYAKHGSSSGLDKIGSASGCDISGVICEGVACGTLNPDATSVNATPTALDFREELTP